MQSGIRKTSFSLVLPGASPGPVQRQGGDVTSLPLENMLCLWVLCCVLMCSDAASLQPSRHLGCAFFFPGFEEIFQPPATRYTITTLKFPYCRQRAPSHLPARNSTSLVEVCVEMSEDGKKEYPRGRGPRVSEELCEQHSPSCGRGERALRGRSREGGQPTPASLREGAAVPEAP